MNPKPQYYWAGFTSNGQLLSHRVYKTKKHLLLSYGHAWKRYIRTQGHSVHKIKVTVIR